jgi:hypothetical protein
VADLHGRQWRPSVARILTEVSPPREQALFILIAGGLSFSPPPEILILVSRRIRPAVGAQEKTVRCILLACDPAARLRGKGRAVLIRT